MKEFLKREEKEIEKIQLFLEREESFQPRKEDIFKVFTQDIKDIKIVILGMDPYPQEGVATGRAFEVVAESWQSKNINSSLRNILKLLYKTYINSEEYDIKKVREGIEDGSFPIMPPQELFDNLEKQGVLWLNTALTVETKKPGSHIKVWKGFSERLIKYIDENGNDIIFFLWGGKAKGFSTYITNNRYIYHNHPAIAGNIRNEKDFLNGTSFKETMGMINWLGKKEG